MSPADASYLAVLIDFGLTEDLGDDRDVTSRATIPDGLKGRAAFVARAPGVLAALKPRETAIKQAVESARSEFPTLPVEVEVDSLEQLDQALAVRPDIVLLDNMPPERMREAVARRNAAAPEVKLEASGGVNLQTVRAIAETGVDRISVGALTHSAKALDIALDYIG